MSQAAYFATNAVIAAALWAFILSAVALAVWGILVMVSARDT